jgi:hypothetical protein
MDEPIESLDFKSFFNERVKAKGMSLKKLADLSGVPIVHLERMSRGNYTEFPAAPYLRGYLRILGRILGFDHHVWLDYFDHIRILKVSGTTDQLPTNRYAHETAVRYAWLIALGVILLLYLGFRFSKILGTPSLLVTAPTEAMIKTDTSPFEVAGSAKGSDEVKVNSEPVIVSPDGSWNKEIALQPGLNTIEVVARKILGGERRITRELIYEPKTSPASPFETPAVIGEPRIPTSTPTSTPPPQSSGTTSSSLGQ